MKTAIEADVQGQESAPLKDTFEFWHMSGFDLDPTNNEIREFLLAVEVTFGTNPFAGVSAETPPIGYPKTLFRLVGRLSAVDREHAFRLVGDTSSKLWTRSRAWQRCISVGRAIIQIDSNEHDRRVIWHTFGGSIWGSNSLE